MRWPFGISLTIPVGLFLHLLFCAPLLAREDSARLVFQKTADIRSSRVYVIKKGESIERILRRQMGTKSVPRTLIRQLNPDIRDLNRIYPGQRIILPVHEKAGLPDPSITVPRQDAPPAVAYRIQERDSISRIILTELDVRPAEVLPTYRLIRRLNPGITDPNNLPAGEIINLPPHLDSQKPMQPKHLQAATLPAEKIREGKATRLPPAADGLLGIIHPVISRMKGSVIARGNYFIPLRENARVAIDCSLIPVVELDDGTTVLLDFGNLLSEGLRDLILQSWPSYGFLTADELRDGFSSLQGIIRRSRNYTMVRTDRPLALTAKPEVLAFPAWIISGKELAGRIPYRQGLFLLTDSNRSLPAEIRNFLEKNGLPITEIGEGRAVLPAPSTFASSSTIPDLNGLKGIALAERLLSALGETPARNAEVAIFDRVRDGFSLSVTSDLLLRKGEKRYILHSKRLPEQFVRVLKEAGTEVIFCGDQETGRPLIEGLLRNLNIPFSFGYFSLRIPEEDRHPRMTVSFSALKAAVGSEPLYLIDFDLPPDALPLFQGRRGGRVVRY